MADADDDDATVVDNDGDGGGALTMAGFTGDEVLEATGGTLVRGAAGRRVRRVCTDSRTVRAGDLFVALRGARVDGRRFVGEALSRGAHGAVLEAGGPAVPGGGGAGRRRVEPFIVTVRDSVRAYQDLASFHRGRFLIPVIAVTGSNGKTTTKDMVAATLARRWRLTKTAGNENNRIGLPQTVLTLTASRHMAVLEFGVDAGGQTSRLAEIARPTVGVITNVGRDHLHAFGDIDGSARAKAELLAHLPADGVAVLNADDPYYEFLRRRARCAVVSFGLNARADIRGSHLQRLGARTEFRLHVAGRRPARLSLRVHGAHNVLNALAALAVGHALGLPVSTMAVGLSRFRPPAMRSQVLSRQGLTVIHDCYNANPDSMSSALALLRDVGAGRRTIAVLGDMLDLGPTAAALHEEVGAHVADNGTTWCIACGAFGAALARGATGRGMSPSRIVTARHTRDAVRILNRLAQPGDVVLLKASRGMRLEHLLDRLAVRRRRT